MKSKLFFILLLVATIFSCKKETTLEENTLVGKWKLEEVLHTEAYSLEKPQWQAVANNDSYYLEFLDNGNYKKEYIDNTIPPCVGTYSIEIENRLLINSNCNQGTEYKQIDESTLLDF